MLLLTPNCSLQENLCWSSVRQFVETIDASCHSNENETQPDAQSPTHRPWFHFYERSRARPNVSFCPSAREFRRAKLDSSSRNHPRPPNRETRSKGKPVHPFPARNAKTVGFLEPVGKVVTFAADSPARNRQLFLAIWKVPRNQLLAPSSPGGRQGPCSARRFGVEPNKNGFEVSQLFFSRRRSYQER